MDANSGRDRRPPAYAKATAWQADGADEENDVFFGTAKNFYRRQRRKQRLERIFKTLPYLRFLL
jgi:hypothetical protein